MRWSTFQSNGSRSTPKSYTVCQWIMKCKH